MRLANSEIAISLDNETIHLRASLRAAYRLERSYEGFQNLSQAIALCSLGALVDVIREGCPDPTAVDRFFNALSATSVNETVNELREPFLRFVLLLAGVDEQNQPGSTSGTPIPFEEYFTKLFRIATGWLGWTPEQAWNATPAEIIEAQLGRSEMLAAIFGTKGQDEATTVTDIASIRDRLNAIGDTNVTSVAQVP
jgi:hypothetical protein